MTEKRDGSGLLLNCDGHLFLRGTVVSEIDLGNNSKRIWDVLKEVEPHLESMAGGPLFVDSQKNVLSVDAMRASFPAMVRGYFEGDGYDQYASWLEQLEDPQ